MLSCVLRPDLEYDDCLSALPLSVVNVHSAVNTFQAVQRKVCLWVQAEGDEVDEGVRKGNAQEAG